MVPPHEQEGGADRGQDRQSHGGAKSGEYLHDDGQSRVAFVHGPGGDTLVIRCQPRFGARGQGQPGED